MVCLRYCSDYREYYFDSVRLAKRDMAALGLVVLINAAWQPGGLLALAAAGETVSGTWLGAETVGWQLSSQSGHMQPTLMLVDIRTVCALQCRFSAISFEINGVSFSKI